MRHKPQVTSHEHLVQRRWLLTLLHDQLSELLEEVLVAEEQLYLRIVALLQLRQQVKHLLNVLVCNVALIVYIFII